MRGLTVGDKPFYLDAPHKGRNAPGMDKTRRRLGKKKPPVAPEDDPAASMNGKVEAPSAEPASGREAAPVAASPRGLLGELLVDRQLISRSQLAEALLQQSASGKRLGALLVDLGALDELQLARMLAQQLDLPLADLRQAAPDEQVIALLPESIARAHTVIPIRQSEVGLEVAMADPLDEETLRQVEEAVEGNVVVLVAPPSEIRRAIDKSYRALAAVERHVEAFLATEALTATVLEEGDAAETAPVV